MRSMGITSHERDPIKNRSPVERATMEEGELLFMGDVMGDSKMHAISTRDSKMHAISYEGGMGLRSVWSAPITRLRSFVYHLFLPTGRVRGGRG